MQIVKRQGSEIRTGDVIHHGTTPFFFIGIQCGLVEAQEMSDRRLFVRERPEYFGLSLEHDASSEAQ